MKRFENLLLPQNILSSLVVFVIAVPLSLGIALGSGMPPTSALVGAVAGGIIIGILSGAPLVVSGPAAGLSALVLTYVQQFGVGAIYRITILLGFAQILFGLFRLGKIINKIPKPVLEGVLSAIGLVILLGQLHVLMGQKMPGSPTANVLGVPASFVGSITNQPTGSLPAFLFGGAALLIQLFWGRLFPRLRGIPAALPACLVVTLVSLPFDGVPRVHIDSILQHMANESASMWVLSSWADWKLWLGAVVGLSVVASAESLLTARAIQIVAQNKNLPTSTHFDKELFAQGAGNLLSGMFGGMPLTGVMVRSAANVDAGGTNRLSTIFHGVWVLVFVTLAPSILKTIPLSVLASILIITGIKLLNVPGMLRELKHHRSEAIFWPITATAILFTDLLKGLIIGIVLYAVSAMRKKR